MAKLKQVLQQLLQAAQAEDLTPFLGLLERQGSSGEIVDLSEAIQALDGRGNDELCAGLLQLAQLAISEAVPSEGGEAVIQGEAWKDSAVAALLGVAGLVQGMLEQDPTSRCTSALHPVASELHDSVLLAASEHPALQEAVSKFCELWWCQEIEGREALVAQTLPYLLVRSLTSGKAADVKRCNSMRDALLLLDYEDPSIIDLKRLLLRAAFAPSFLRNAQGRRFLSFLFTVHPSLVRELVAIIRNQIPSGRQSVLEAYGEILFRAWKDAVGPTLLEIEQGVQGLMNASILASEPSLASSLRTVLGGFHSQKHIKGVDAMLLRLYEPILFRALVAPNASVRCNSLNVLGSAFPLQDPEMEGEEVDQLLTRQFTILADCFDDPVPMVRKAATSVTCQLLNVWWELVPSATTAQFLKRLAGLAFDGTSAAVRTAAISGLTDLVDNALAQPLLKVVLPALAPLLDDPSMKVRLALVNLLTVVRSVRAIQFYEIVSVDKLLDVLADGPPELAAKLQQLLMPSFFPSPEEGPARIAGLLKRSLEAGRAFCRSLTSGYGAKGKGGRETAAACIPLDQLGELLLSFRDHLTEAAKRIGTPNAEVGSGASGGKQKGKKRKGPRSARNASAGEPDEQQATEQESETVEGWEAIIAGLAELCTGLASSNAPEEEALAILEEVFEDGGLADLLRACPSAKARVSVLSIASAMPDMPASCEVRGRCLMSLVTDSDVKRCAVRKDEAIGYLTAVSAGPSGLTTLLRLLEEALENGTMAADGDKDTNQRAAQCLSAIGDIRCKACKSTQDEASMLLCDGCNSAYHLKCLRPRLTEVPKEDWFCSACSKAIEAGLTVPQALAYLGLMLESCEPRKALVGSGRLPHLLSALRRWVDINGHKMSIDLTTAGSGTASTLDKDTCQLLPFAMQLMCRAAVHLAVSEREVHLTAPQPKDNTESTQDSEGTQAYQQALNSAVALVADLRVALEGALDSACLSQPSSTADLEGRSPLLKKSKPAASIASAKACECVVAAVSMFPDAAMLRLPGWAGTVGRGQSDMSKICEQSAQLACSTLTSARKLAASPWTSGAPLAGHLDLLLSHVAKFSRCMVLPQNEQCQGRLFQHDTGATELATVTANEKGHSMMNCLVRTAVGSDSTDKQCMAVLRPFLPGLVAAVAASCGREKGAAQPWLEPILQSVGEVFSTIQAEELEGDTLDTSEFIQEIVILQPLMHAFKFLNHTDALICEIARAAPSLWTKGDPVAALGALHALWLLGYRSTGRRHQAARDELDTLRGQVDAFEPSPDSEHSDTIAALKTMPLLAQAQSAIAAA